MSWNDNILLHEDISTDEFWQGTFGDEYTKRNVNLVENNYQMFKTIFFEKILSYSYMININSIIEFGAGSGQNILALQKIFPDAVYSAWEINRKACDELLKDLKLNVFEFSILDYDIVNINNSLPKHDIVLTKGLLIHIHPDDIEKAYEVLYNASNKYILLCEYYSPNRIMIPYKDKDNKLWKFDFVKPLLNKNCKILDYGFVSKYDQYPQDDITWFLMEK